MKTLYFEGAGMAGADISKATIGNCRIRTAFHLDNGKPVYLEITAGERTKRNIEVYKWRYTGFVDACFYITDDRPNDDCNLHRLLKDGGEEEQKEAEAFFRKRMSTEFKTCEEAAQEYRTACDYGKRFVERNEVFEYSEAGILDFLRSIGASFDAITVSNERDGYRAFREDFRGGTDGYYYGDKYEPGEEMLA